MSFCCNSSLSPGFMWVQLGGIFSLWKVQLFDILRYCANLSNTRLKVAERHIVKVEEMQQSVLYMELNRARPYSYTLKRLLYKLSLQWLYTSGPDQDNLKLILCKAALKWFELWQASYKYHWIESNMTNSICALSTVLRLEPCWDEKYVHKSTEMGMCLATLILIPTTNTG